MIAEERWARIVDLVNEQGVLTATELVDALGTSESTIRRDLARLDEMGRLRKVRGGAAKLAGYEFVSADQSIERRLTIRLPEKRAIGEYAATLIGPDDFVFIDGGSTASCLVDAISETRATYFTNSLPLAQKLLAKGCRALLPGGELTPLSEVLVGAETAEQVRRFHFTIGFWGTNGASPQSGFTTQGFGEAAVKQVSIEQTVRPYIICDSTKFQQISLVTFARFADATIITDRVDDDELRRAGTIIEVMAKAQG